MQVFFFLKQEGKYANKILLFLLDFYVMLSKLNMVKESESRSILPDTLQPHGLYTVHGIFQARTLE